MLQGAAPPPAKNGKQTDKPEKESKNKELQNIVIACFMHVIHIVVSLFIYTRHKERSVVDLRK